ncbi:ornithine--oxo-acid transaminase [Longivirga aurantiaca]|uniref:ornithine aminotransferase n=1 Tax=Longivirga aurantiaca TaxID=1837743 RepID=A0ABW1SX95_9ACTN
MSITDDAIAFEHEHCAHNYHPLPVVISEAEGAWVTDIEGRRYLDMLSAYSAINFGHGHPDLVAAAEKQLHRVTLTSRAFHNDQLGKFCADLARLSRHDAVLPMNSGAEGVETALKVARKWGYQKKGVQHDRAQIIVCEGNFHGRTTTIVSFSDDPVARDDYGPYTPGFVAVPYGDVDALAAAITDDTVAFLVEPIQGEAGVVLPPTGYLEAVRELCTERNVLMIADEIQAGMGRAGATFACDLVGVQPDIRILGKALGGGILPVSAVTADWDVLGVIKPGEHGSTFGGNPMAAAVGIAVVALLETGEMQERSKRLGEHVLATLRGANLPGVKEVRGSGLWWAVELDGTGRTGREVSLELLARGILAKDTHTWTIRFAPPLVVSEADLDAALATIIAVLEESVVPRSADSAP